MKILTIYGTRPEAIKVAPFVRALAATPSFSSVVAVTGQHREMLDQVNALFDIKPDFDLDIMVPGASLAEMSSRILAKLDEVLVEVSPDAVVVQGDTSSAFIAALASFYRQIPVIHLEAGLRTGNLSNPFPEEGNRKLIGGLAALHLAPTSTSRANLEREGVDPSSVVVTGNTVIDALHHTLTLPLAFRDPVAERALDGDGKVVLITTHRRESWGSRMEGTMSAVGALADRHPDTRFLLPMHKNSIVREVVEASLGAHDNVFLSEPLPYHEFAHAMNRSHLLLTDSGGVQEEAPSLAKPVLVMRETTERPEAVVAGTVRLVGTDPALIFKEVDRLLTDPDSYEEMARATNPYGDGLAARRSVQAIAWKFGGGERPDEFPAKPHHPSRERAAR